MTWDFNWGGLEFSFTTRRVAWSHHLGLNPQNLKALRYAATAWRRSKLLLHLFQSRLWTFKICDLTPKAKRCLKLVEPFPGHHLTKKKQKLPGKLLTSWALRWLWFVKHNNSFQRSYTHWRQKATTPPHLLLPLLSVSSPFLPPSFSLCWELTRLHFGTQ